MAGAFLEKKQLGVWSLSFIGLTAMLGSGWLLASYYVYKTAGALSPIAWIAGFLMVLVIAFSFAETCSLVDRDGSTVILPRLSHGYFLSAVFGFFGLISWVALIPIEVAATLQYLTFFVHGIYSQPGQLTYFGEGLGIILVVCIALINTFSMVWIKKLNNNLFTPLKIGIPIIIITASLWHARHLSQMVSPIHASVKSVFLALPVGVVFSFNGFKSICVIAGRASNPQKTITQALLIALITCLVLYLGLQYAFNLNAISAVLADSHSPYATILAHSTLMIVLLYIGAISSPFTANIFNLNAANACCYRMAKFGYLPKIFTKTNGHHQYIIAALFNMLISIVLVLNSHRWDTMVQKLTCIMIITYAAAPIAQIVFRDQFKQVDRPVLFKGGKWIGRIGFLLSNIMIFWCGFAAVKLAFICLCAVSFWVIIYYIVSKQTTELSLLRSLWIFVWLGLIVFIDYFSGFGGINTITHPEALGLLVILSVIIAFCFERFALSATKANQYLKDIEKRTSD
jgi:amino acid transporter